MALKKIALKPGVNRENTRYTNEGGYYESDKVRFRQGTPEKIGGWLQLSGNTFLGTCRSLWNWVTLAGANLVGVGTEAKFYIEQTGQYYDITPVVSTSLLGANPITTVNLSATVTVTDILYSPAVGDTVIFSGVVGFNGITLSGSYLVTSVPSGTTYTVTATGTANANGSGGGAVAFATYLLTVGGSISFSFLGWGSLSWGSNTWGGVGQNVSATGIRLWTQFNFGENLLLGPKLGAMYEWNATTSPTLAAPTTVTISNGVSAVVTLTSNTTTPLPNNTALMFVTTGALPLPLRPYTVYYVINFSGTTFNLSLTAGGVAINTTTAGSGVQTISIRAIPVTSLAGANGVPLTQGTLMVSDASRFTLVFGTNEYLSTTYDPMLIRWSDQESVVEWAPSATTKAGSIRLSHGSDIKAVLQSRQEILVFTDAALYSLQFLGAPAYWGSQLLGDNISIVGLNAAAYSNGTAYWMGQDKFYKYDGRVQPLRCDLRQFVYGDINRTQFSQVFAGTNEGFNEVWWFYCTQASTELNRYVVYNYAEDIWYYGSMSRTAWLDSSLRDYPIAATYSNNLVYHEFGVDDGVTLPATAITASITTSQFDIDDGHNFAFVWRMLPDLTFRGSTDGTTPSLTIQLQPLKNSGSGYNNPISVGGTSVTGTQPVVATQIYPIDLDTYTGQLNIRVRGRQMSMKIESTTVGTQWQLGSPRIDIRPDGRR